MPNPPNCLGPKVPSKVPRSPPQSAQPYRMPIPMLFEKHSSVNMRMQHAGDYGLLSFADYNKTDTNSAATFYFPPNRTFVRVLSAAQHLSHWQLSAQQLFQELSPHTLTFLLSQPGVLQHGMLKKSSYV